MSLWKVDDNATCKLMTEFYSNWISKKMTKHQAFEAAKKTKIHELKAHIKNLKSKLKELGYITKEEQDEDEG